MYSDTRVGNTTKHWGGGAATTGMYHGGSQPRYIAIELLSGQRASFFRVFDSQKQRASIFEYK